MKTWLTDLPTTALVIATGCVLAVLTGVFFFGATIAGRAIDGGNWAAWLMFVAAMLGVGYAQFAKKRETYVPSSLGDELFRGKATPARRASGAED